jgi:hypothetical protein
MRICQINAWCDMDDPETVASMIVQLERDIVNLRNRLPADHPITRPNPRAIAARITNNLLEALAAKGMDLPSDVMHQLMRDIRVTIKTERTPAPMTAEKRPF